MKPAVVVVDMLNDNVHGSGAGPVRDAALAIVPRVNRLLAAAAKPEWHEATLSCFRKNILQPLLRVEMLDDVLRATGESCSP